VDTVRIAAVTWMIEPASTTQEFFAHFDRLLALCDGADLVVFPELPCLELLAAKPDLDSADEAAYLAGLLQPFLLKLRPSNKEATLVAGTYFARSDAGIVNTAIVASPSTDLVMTADVPKVVLTQFEAHEWQIVSGRGLRRLPDQRIGVTVCYDCEFPESGRALAESGVLVQCVPAFTETEHGFNRVRTSCRARAIENQTIVVHSSLVGSLGREPVPNAVGSSAILCPCTPPFPADGILAETAMNVEGVAFADIDLDMLLEARKTGDVRNWEDRDKGDWSVSDPTYSV